MAKLLKVTQYWPPFFHLSSVPVTMILGFSVASVAATNFLYLAVAVFSIYGIGRRLFDEEVGAWAVVLTLLYPIVYVLARTVLVDFALLAMVALSLNLVLASDGGLHLRRSWGLGLAAGCAMLTEWTAVVFLSGPALFWLVRCLRRAEHRPVGAAAALGLAALAFAIVALPWYVRAFGPFLEGAKVAFGSAGNRTALRQDLVRRARASAGVLRIALWRTWPLPDGSRAEVYAITDTSGTPGTPAR